MTHGKVFNDSAERQGRSWRTVRGVRGLIAIAIALALSLAASAQLYAQPAPYVRGLPLTMFNDRGISGLWTMTGKVSSNKPPREQIARDENGKLPRLLPGPAAVFEKRLVDAENGKPFATMGSMCMNQGIPLMMFAAAEGPVEILETPGRVVIISTEFDEVWSIYLDQRHQEDLDPNWHGDSVGRWEGDTLVVDTIGLMDRTTVDHVGMPHSADLHVVSRLRRLDKETLEVRVTLNDPKTFVEPWTRKVIYKRGQPGQRLEENRLSIRKAFCKWQPGKPRPPAQSGPARANIISIWPR